MSPETLIAQNFMEKWDWLLPVEKRPEFYKDVIAMHIAIIQSAADKMAMALGQKPVDLSSDE